MVKLSEILAGEILADDAPRQVRIRLMRTGNGMRVRARLLQMMRQADEPGAITESKVMAEMIACADAAVGGHGMVMQEGAPYEVAPPIQSDMSTIVRNFEARIDRLERDAFWQKSRGKSPEKGSAPVLPKPEWVEEAVKRFPHIYGAEADAD